MKVGRENIINLMLSTYFLKKSDFRGGYIANRLIRDDEDIDLRGCVLYKCYIQDEPKGAIIADRVPNLKDLPYNFQGMNLEGLDLSRLNLRGANFKSANLRNVNFTQANLSKANFVGAGIEGAIFEGANLAGLQRTEEDICEVCNRREDSQPTYLRLGRNTYRGYACEGCRTLCIRGCDEYTSNHFMKCLNCGTATL